MMLASFISNCAIFLLSYAVGYILAGIGYWFYNEIKNNKRGK